MSRVSRTRRAIGRVHVESWRTTYRGIVPDDMLASLSAERRTQTWARVIAAPGTKSAVFVAEDGDGALIGFAAGGTEREHDPVYTGELYAIYLVAEHQKKGIGARLARRVATWLADAGHRAMLVWVLAENPARHFYAALGGIPLREKSAVFGNAKLVKVAYGWPHIEALICPADGC